MTEEKPPCKMLLVEDALRICKFAERSVEVKWSSMELLMVELKPMRLGLEINKRISFSFAFKLSDAKLRRWCLAFCSILALSSYGPESRPSIGGS